MKTVDLYDFSKNGIEESAFTSTVALALCNTDTVFHVSIDGHLLYDRKRTLPQVEEYGAIRFVEGAVMAYKLMKGI